MLEEQKLKQDEELSKYSKEAINELNEKYVFTFM